MDRHTRIFGNRRYNTLFKGQLNLENIQRNRPIVVRRTQLNPITGERINWDIGMALRLQPANGVILKILDHQQANNFMYIGYESYDYSLKELWNLDSGNKDEKRFIEFLKRLLDGIRGVHERNIAFNNISLDTVVVRNKLGDLLPKIYDLSMTSEVDDNFDRVRDLKDFGRLIISLLMEDVAQTLAGIFYAHSFDAKKRYLIRHIQCENDWIGNENAANLSIMIIRLIEARDYSNDMINSMLELPFAY